MLITHIYTRIITTKIFHDWLLFCKQCDVCVCNMQQTIEHLLLNCFYVKPFWRVVESLCNIQVSFEVILVVHDWNDYDNLITVVSFLIYNQWLIYCHWIINQGVEILEYNTLKRNCWLVCKFTSYAQSSVLKKRWIWKHWLIIYKLVCLLYNDFCASRCECFVHIFV